MNTVKICLKSDDIESHSSILSYPCHKFLVVQRVLTNETLGNEPRRYNRSIKTVGNIISSLSRASIIMFITGFTASSTAPLN